MSALITSIYRSFCYALLMEIRSNRHELMERHRAFAYGS
jgi:hypothetical protein